MGEQVLDQHRPPRGENQMDSAKYAAFYGCLLLGLTAATSACGDEEGEASGGSGPSGSSDGSGGGDGTGGVGGGSGATGGQGGGGDCGPETTPSESSCVLTDELGIFVAATGDDTAAGTRDMPVKTLTHAVQLAQETGKRVYACAQTFSEVIGVPAGVEIYGGLACETDWSWVASKPTQITAAADQVPVMRLYAGEGKTVLSDLRVTASDASAPGGSSIAVIVDGAEADLVRCVIEAGEAQHGAAGASPSGPAAAGPNGIEGGDAGCNAASAAGGAQVVNAACPTSIGGKGGDSAVSGTIGGGNGSDGQPAATMSGTAGDGGAGQPSTATNSGPMCTAGQPGEAGEPGTAGVGGVGKGSLTSAGYVGIAGTGGTPGKPAQGGGGGGGGKGCLDGSPKGDDAGGSGGAGGCGGTAAVPGSAGGASIALVLLGATVTLEDCIVSSSTAGNGGAAGAAQLGGPGGIGGAGSSDGLYDLFSGCKGGNGGVGGTGGAAGGGAGGHSLAIAYQGTAPTKVGGTFKHGASGTGGLGSGNSLLLAGSDGIAAESQEF
jgi:hypothetical protein